MTTFERLMLRALVILLRKTAGWRVNYEIHDTIQEIKKELEKENVRTV